MHLLAITDIHGRVTIPEMIREVIRSADLLTIAGDLTDFGGEAEARQVLETIQKENKQILAVPGNCDTSSVNHALTAERINIHGEITKIKEIAFMGIGGCGKTPFGTPQEYSEREIIELLHGFRKQGDVRYHILVSHAPPSDTSVDRTFLGRHVGSKALRDFIETFQPDLVLCGHIHEARGVDHIGTSLIINPGPFPKHYAHIRLTDDIEYEIY